MNCIYHPTAQAHHHCSHCDQRFCEKCLDEPSVTRNTESTALCFICEAELTHLQSSNSIQPFWSRLGEIYKYPISMQALITILLIALSSAMLQGFGLFSLVPIVAINLYSFSCLRETASGDLEAPGVEASFQGSIAPVLYVGLSMFIAMLLAGAAFNSLGYGMGVISSLVLILIMPAVIILIAIDEQLLAALSPVRFIGVIKTTGASYFVMVLFIIVMLFSVDILGSTFANTNFRALSVFLSALIFCYYNIVMFHIMGYLVYQNHTELGYRSSVKNSNTQTKARNPTQRRKAQLEVLIKAGHYTAARDLAAKIIKHGAPLWEWERIFKLYCAAKPSANIDKYFASYATKLIEANEYEKLADATLLIKRVMPDFSLANHDHKLECANALLSVGKHVIGINMIKNLPNESQDSEVIGRALELLAKAYNHVPGGERSAKNFHSLHTQHIAKYQT